MNFKPVLIALSFFFLLSTNLYSQDYYKYSGAISYLDGTPIEMSQSDIDQFHVDLDRSPDIYAAYVSGVKNGNITLSCLVTGTYTMKFMGFEIVRFSVSEVEGQFKSNLPSTLILPFNYIAITEPFQTVQIYDKNINLKENIVANKNGELALKGDEKYFSDKIIVVESENGFPAISFFKTQKAANKGRFNSRKRKFSKVYKPQAKRGVLHTIQDDIYYTLHKINFSNDNKNTTWLLKTYNAQQKKGSVHKLDFSSYKRSTDKSLILDENGKVIVVLKQPMKSNKYEYQSLIVSKNGSLRTDKNTFVYPYYRFKDNFVENTRWIIPTFSGIALPEGGHNFTVTCNGIETVPNPANVAWHKRMGELRERGRKAKSDEERKSIGEAIQNMPDEPKPGNFENIVGTTSTESFTVFLSPFANDLWKINSPFDIGDKNEDKIVYDRKCVKKNPASETYQEQVNKIRYQKLDPKARQEAMQSLGPRPTPACLKWDSTARYSYTRYFPGGVDPNPDHLIHNIRIKECVISVDGKGQMGYSYIDEDTGKGVHYADWDNEEDKKKALKYAFENATRYIGFGGEGSAWGKTFDIFEYGKWDLTSNQPINSWEGPYPELRYGFREILGQYASMKEARQHCKSPRYNNRNKKYECSEEKIITVCLDNYQFKMVDGRPVTNYDALYCGEKDPEPDNDKGNEIAVDVSAIGYISTSRALLKRDKEASEIMFSGHILDKKGKPIKDAKVSLRGYNKETETDELGQFNLFAKTRGEEPYSESMDIKLQKIGFEISNEELGVYEDDYFGLVSDGFTTLKLKVKAGGIRPQTVIVKQPQLGSFVEQGMLKLALILNADGEGEMEYVPPTYLTDEDLNKSLILSDSTKNKYGLKTQLRVAEVPIEFTYEDEDGNPRIFTLKILVMRPPVLLIHGFTGDESTWADLANYLRVRKFEPIVHEYYRDFVFESTIERQSQKIQHYIQELRQAYFDNKILQTRVDIVAHSMGGLMSRHYISNMARYGEKAGIYIPYNVKLSREELAAARNQKPVKLIDIRKLIMVGTPNHGSTNIDGLLGYLSAVTSNWHLIANSQLLATSQFMANLNAGENEGRHLDKNVQYALLYGRRRGFSIFDDSEFKKKDISEYKKIQFLDPRALAFDDGVVKVSSAKLNGVIDFQFPKEENSAVGYIHSPAIGDIYWGDLSITTDEAIFDKVNELLLEDIPRMPLKNTYTRIISNTGRVFKRFYSHKSWELLPENSNKKFNNGFFQMKTEEGNAHIGFFLNNHHWGSIHLQSNTEIQIANASPEFVEVYLKKGKARFKSRKQGGGGFDVVMGDEGEKWYEFNPKAKVVDVNTDFIIEEGETLNVQSINGKVIIGIPKEKVDESIEREISSNEGISLNPQGEITKKPLAASGWWSSIDTTFSADEVIKKSGIHILKDIVEPIVKKIVEPLLENTAKPVVKEVAKAIPNHLPIMEDFTNGFANWDHHLTKLENIDGKLFWEDDEKYPLILKTPIPVQNVIIEFDGWTEKNGITIEWFNSRNKGYSISLGAFSNYKSLIGIKNGKRYDFTSIAGAHLTFKTWQHYKIILQKDRIKVYVDDELIGQKTIDENLRGGGSLYFSSYQSRIGIDNVSIYKGTSNTP